MSARRRRARGTRRAHRVRRPGFWLGLRRATHLDFLRHRVGAATGRRLVRWWNRRHPNRKIPLNGTWFTGTPSTAGIGARPLRVRAAAGTRAPRPTKPAATKPAATKPAATKPTASTRTAWKGPGVTTTKPTPATTPMSGGAVKASTGTVRTAPVRPGTTSVRGAGTRGPGNAGNGLGPGQYGTGGASGNGAVGGMGTSGQAGAFTPSSPPSTINPTGGTGSRPLAGSTGTAHRGWPTPPGMPVAKLRTARPTFLPTGPPSNGGTPTMTTTDTGTGAHAAGAEMEAPETAAEYVGGMRERARRLASDADALGEYQATLIEMGFDTSVLDRIGAAGENIAAAAECLGGAVTDFMTAYAAIIEATAEGLSVPGMNGFWSEAVE